MTAHWRNLMRIAGSLFKTCQQQHQDQRQTGHSRTTLRTSTQYPTTWESLGRGRRTSLSQQLQHSSAYSGTSMHAWWGWDQRKLRNMSKPSKSGEPGTLTTSMMSKSYTASCCMPAWWYQQDECGLQHWKPCSDSVVTVLTFHATPTKGLPMTFGSGNPPSREPISVNPSQNQSSSSIMLPILMPAQGSELLSRLESNGMHGDSSQVSSHWEARKTLHGPKLLASNSSYMQSPGIRTLNSITGYMATTREWWRDGGMGGAVMVLSMRFSNNYTNTSVDSRLKPTSTLPTFPVPTTQPTYCYERTFILSFSILSYLILSRVISSNLCLYIWTLLLSYQGHMATAW